MLCVYCVVIFSTVSRSCHIQKAPSGMYYKEKSLWFGAKKVVCSPTSCARSRSGLYSTTKFLFRCIQLENQRIIVVLDLLMLKQMFINLRGLCTFQVLFISILKSASVV